MSYRVLARTYRSNTFDEVVGQETLATTLKNAITSGRVHHGYLFTGTRGVGKTSMARILAKALNCLAFDEPTITPCCECDSCKAVALGDDVDVVEIDAASNNGVDHIRELRSNAGLRPARARYKIYIVAEVHMLSTPAFNALLKILEEPPSHVKFILATTEAQKVPATIQSRCQRFDFRAIDGPAITKHLQHIMEKEGISADEAVLRRIARLANGSMRDALSLLDKLLSYDAERVTTEVANEVIPPPHDELAFAVMECVANQDAAGALRSLDDALQSGRTVDRFCEHLIEHVRTLMLLSVCGADTELVDVGASMRPKLFEQSAHYDAPTYVYMITLLEELRRNVKSSSAARALADATVVRLAMSRQFTDIHKMIEQLESEQPAPPAGDSAAGAKKNETARATVAQAQRTQKATAQIAKSVHRTTNRPSVPIQAAAPPPASLSSAEWERVTSDPLVMRVKEAVDGTLLHVRPAAAAKPANANVPDDGSNAEDDLASSMTA